MVTGPGERPLTVTEQLIPRRLQVAPEGNETLPVPPVWEKVIVSPEIEPKKAPLMLAVQDEAAPTASEAGAQETEVAVRMAPRGSPQWGCEPAPMGVLPTARVSTTALLLSEIAEKDRKLRFGTDAVSVPLDEAGVATIRMAWLASAAIGMASVKEL